MFTEREMKKMKTCITHRIKTPKKMIYDTVLVKMYKVNSDFYPSRRNLFLINLSLFFSPLPPPLATVALQGGNSKRNLMRILIYVREMGEGGIFVNVCV